MIHTIKGVADHTSDKDLLNIDVRQEKEAMNVSEDENQSPTSVDLYPLPVEGQSVEKSLSEDDISVKSSEMDGTSNGKFWATILANDKH